MPVVFIDETGYTGPDLLNEAQPVFVLASHNFEEQEACAIKSRFFGKVRAKELKYAAMRMRPRQQAMIIDFVKDLSRHQGRVGFAYAHKPFCIVTKAVDLIIEPSMHEHGVNLYHRGGNIGLSNMIYFFTRSFAGKAYLRRLLDALQTFLREPCGRTCVALDSVLESKTGLSSGRTDAPDPLKQVLGFLHLPLLAMDVRDIRRLSSKDDLEICLSFALCLMASWGSQLGEEILLIHDASSEMSKNRDLWDKIVSPNVPPAKVGWDRRTMEFPIRIRDTRFERSVDWAGLQLADVLAGAIAECLRSLDQPSGERTDYVDQLWTNLGEWSCEEHIWPEQRFSPDELDTEKNFANDPIQHMMELVSRSSGGRPPGGRRIIS